MLWVSLRARLLQCLCFAFQPNAGELVSPAGCEHLGFRRCVGALETFNGTGRAVSASLLISRWFVELDCIRFAASAAQT